MTWLDSMVCELDRVRTPGDGLLRPMKRGQFRPAERNAYVSEMAKRYHTSVPREKKLRDLEHLVDPTGVVAVAAAQTGTSDEPHVAPDERDGKRTGLGLAEDLADGPLAVEFEGLRRHRF